MINDCVSDLAVAATVLSASCVLSHLIYSSHTPIYYPHFILLDEARHRESRDLPSVTQLVSFKARGQIVFFFPFLLNLSLPTGGSDGKESAGDAL